ncbi:acyl--CoA ligase [Phenylobacterium sp. LH3H17]|uniref:acyl--CoA ligase n=1 Tax=Phenylobacterium sp. LH3H17 TaxID=2903901 RepID=UPI0020C96CFE|nr:acyl--CoA ligase [Phenylobacterium sp. LH3H17]UTP38623.1 acyl--CoA ligase [Phenylobacterium sp. LH3H17]
MMEYLFGGADAAPAICEIDGPTLSYGDLNGLSAAVRARLAALGLGHGDRLALVMPNGVEMAVAFVAFSSATAIAPLNPAYTSEEFRFYMEDAGVRALVVGAMGNAAAEAAAERLGLPILRFAMASEDGKLDARINATPVGPARQPRLAGSLDLALLLHTSGTTSRPKLVPLSHAKLQASAQNIVQTLRLAAGDRCLNIMPLFHIHGLVGVLASSLHAGATVVCTPGFNALSMFRWLEQGSATWYSAVPTMHQAIAARGQRAPSATRALGLRFVRSSSSPLAPSVLRQLEDVFGCPVIEAYGMTEAAHQIASNPLPPGERRAGSVGRPVGMEVAIMDETGELLSPGQIGEVVLRGANLLDAYEHNPEATEQAFAHGWFHTGDQGAVDAEGYLTLTGRLKEIINRGGEKISPREVDEALLDHPAVAEALTFALPHDLLGETVAALVVLQTGAMVTEREIVAFVARRLAAFKVPGRIMFLDELPKGPTGKLQRIGLADRLGLR